MRKTAQHCFYPIITVLLLAQYIHNEFTNAQATSSNSEEQYLQELQLNENAIFLKNEENNLRIVDSFGKEEQGEKRSLEIFVLKVGYKNEEPQNKDSIMIIDSCRAYIEAINSIETQFYRFDCLNEDFKLKKTKIL